MLFAATVDILNALDDTYCCNMKEVLTTSQYLFLLSHRISQYQSISAVIGLHDNSLVLWRLAHCYSFSSSLSQRSTR